jgi:hypothetical protein
VVTSNSFRVWFPQPEIGSVLGIKEFRENTVAFELSLTGGEVMSKPLPSVTIPEIAAMAA